MLSSSPLLKTLVTVSAVLVGLVVAVVLVATGNTLVLLLAIAALLLGAAVATLGVAQVARKLAQLTVVLFVVTIFTFLLVRLLPGEPEDLLVPLSTSGEDETARRVVQERKDAIREDLGLNDSLPSQYVSWVSDFATGDLGNEYTVSSTRPVEDKVSRAVPASLQLILYSQLIALLIAIPLGVLTAYRQNGLFDRIANASAFGMLSLPNFALALLLAYWIGVRSSLPVNPQGYAEFGLDTMGDHFRQMVLPAVSLAVGQIAVYMRLLRSDMIQTLQEDFILMAKSKGVSSSRVLWRHALRPSSLTLLTVAGLNVGALIGGAVVIEVIFGIPGMGSLIAESILRRQYVVLQSCVAIVAIAFVLINAVLDIVYSILDPRIRNVRAAS
ncbi:MAG TPA: ABC transporter permease [Acidimicrobiales bacterium]|nr:ABC transporter permease [Acidimicrobiales bacterium]